MNTAQAVFTGEGEVLQTSALLADQAFENFVVARFPDETEFHQDRPPFGE